MLLLAATACADVAGGVLATSAVLVAAAVGGGAVTAVLVVSGLPWLVVGVPVGALVDRVDRRVLLVLANGGRAAAAGVLGVVLLVGVPGLPVLLVAGGRRAGDRVPGDWVPGSRVSENQEAGAGRGGVRAQGWRASGLVDLLRNPVLRILAITSGATTLGSAAHAAALVLYAVPPGPLGLSGAQYGVAVGAVGLGATVGSLVTARLIALLGWPRLLLLSRFGWSVVFAAVAACTLLLIFPLRRTFAAHRVRLPGAVGVEGPLGGVADASERAHWVQRCFPRRRTRRGSA